MNVRRKDVVLEIMSLLTSFLISGGWMVAKKIRDHAEAPGPDEAFVRVNKKLVSRRQAKEIVAAALARIALVDEGS